mmetsp:Transcript_62012/g.199944  ORF Transcript_62012/g.199944 Transcript_62012/m.199944 type:complete len:212 (+) Transcript_62012:269-904(+)
MEADVVLAHGLVGPPLDDHGPRRLGDEHQLADDLHRVGRVVDGVRHGGNVEVVLSEGTLQLLGHHHPRPDHWHDVKLVHQLVVHDGERIRGHQLEPRPGHRHEVEAGLRDRPAACVKGLDEGHRPLRPVGGGLLCVESSPHVVLEEVRLRRGVSAPHVVAIRGPLRAASLEILLPVEALRLPALPPLVVEGRRWALGRSHVGRLTRGAGAP